MRNVKVGTPSEYAKATKMMIKSGCCTLDDLNAANHMALEQGMITLEHFQAAARILVAELMKQ